MGPRARLDGCRKSRPHRASIPDRPARIESLHTQCLTSTISLSQADIAVTEFMYISQINCQSLDSGMFSELPDPYLMPKLFCLK